MRQLGAWLLRFGMGFALSVGINACGSSGDDDDSKASGGSGDTSHADGDEWPGDPCSLLTDEDFAKLDPATHIEKSEAHNQGSDEFSPECRFYAYLEDGEPHATVAIFVDPKNQFELQKDIFKGERITELGNDAWQGNDGKKANDTIGVLLDDFSFRVDTTYEYGYADLRILAEAAAARIE